MQYTRFSGKDALALIAKLDTLSTQLLSPSEQSQRTQYLQRAHELYNLCGTIRVQPSPPSTDGIGVFSGDPAVEEQIAHFGSREAYAQVLSDEFDAIQSWTEAITLTVEQRFQKLFDV